MKRENGAEKSFCQAIRDSMPTDAGPDVSQRPALVLAYVGDTVYDLYIRTLLLSRHDATAHTLHVLASRYVCAKAQAEAMARVAPHLSEAEAALCRRGRNAKVNTTPKNAKLSDYLAATGFEALLGFLFLQGEDERLMEIMRLSIDPAIEL